MKDNGVKETEKSLLWRNDDLMSRIQDSKRWRFRQYEEEEKKTRMLLNDEL